MIVLCSWAQAQLQEASSIDMMMHAFVASLAESKRCSSFEVIADNAKASSSKKSTTTITNGGRPRKNSIDRWAPSFQEEERKQVENGGGTGKVKQSFPLPDSIKDPKSSAVFDIMSLGSSPYSAKLSSPKPEHDSKTSLIMNESAICLDLADFLVPSHGDESDEETDAQTAPTLDQSSSTICTTTFSPQREAASDSKNLGQIKLHATHSAEDLLQRGPSQQSLAQDSLPNAFVSSLSSKQSDDPKTSAIDVVLQEPPSVSNSKPSGQYRMLKNWGKEVPDESGGIKRNSILSSSAPPIPPRRKNSRDMSTRVSARRQQRNRNKESPC